MTHSLRVQTCRATVAWIVLLVSSWVASAGANLPPFGRDTVLVWSITNQEEGGTFVVRIAEFSPNRFIEWETSVGQGTVYMSSNAVANARTFINSRLFESGVDTKRKDATTLWLSQKIFRDLSSNKRMKIVLDGVDGWMTLEGKAELMVEVNRTPTPLPVIVVKDDRGQERWFLDFENNPLMAKQIVRSFNQTLKSITTDKSNTLRWIKGRKLTSPR